MKHRKTSEDRIKLLFVRHLVIYMLEYIYIRFFSAMFKKSEYKFVFGWEIMVNGANSDIGVFGDLAHWCAMKAIILYKMQGALKDTVYFVCKLNVHSVTNVRIVNPLECQILVILK